MPKKFSKPHLSRIINGDIEPPETPETPPKTRLDIALQTKYPQLNRSTLKKYIKAAQVTVNDQIITKPSTPVLENDEVLVHFLDSGQSAFLGKNEGFSMAGSKEKLHFPEKNVWRGGQNPGNAREPIIIFEDKNVIVLDKPPGLLTISKGDFNPEPTLEPYGHIVHRLDRDTSGVIIIAKNPKTKSSLQAQFQNRRTHKTYYAIVVGHPKLDAALIDIPIARSLKAPTTFQPDPEGREAITQYRIIRSNKKYSLLELKPQTGRTHQIRVHLAHIGTPILGDKIYGQTPADRMYLHATELEITIPTSQRKTFTSKLPEDFENVLRKP